MAWLVHAGEGDENTSLLTTEHDSVQGEIGALRVITSRYRGLITYIQPLVEAISTTQTQKSLTQYLIPEWQ